MSLSLPCVSPVILEHLPSRLEDAYIGDLKLTLDLPKIQAQYWLNRHKNVVILFMIKGVEKVFTTYYPAEVEFPSLEIAYTKDINDENDRQSSTIIEECRNEKSYLFSNMFEGVRQFSVHDTRSFFEDLEKDPESASVFFKEAFMYCPVSMN